ncbi:MAG: Uma2 family endonuclease [Gemmataceae bacterium]
MMALSPNLELAPGDNLTAEEFIRRYENMPGMEKAELIGGVVYMPSPVSVQHGDLDSNVNLWLGLYPLHTPGCKTSTNASVFMLRDVPQPDQHLRILTEYGGRTRKAGKYLQGAPEVIVEVARSSVSIDLHQKKDLYEGAGVPEYVVVLVEEGEVRWHQHSRSGYRKLPQSRDGVFRSEVLPGLWLHAKALLAGDMPQVVRVLNDGLDSPEHTEFVAQLAEKRRKSRRRS